MNIRKYLCELHPDLSLVDEPELLNDYYASVFNERFAGYKGPAPRPLHRSLAEWSVNDAARDLTGTDIGLVVCTWNRPKYLEQCLDSLTNTELDGTLTVIVDDASGDVDTLNLIRQFDLETPLVKIFKCERRQIHHSLDLGWSFLKNIGCRYLTNLDSDAIVARDWLAAVRKLFLQHSRARQDIIVSGFNRRQSEDVIEERRDCRVRNRLGGINYFLRADLFDQLRRFLFTTAWDTLVQVHFERHRAHGYRMLCTKPSYVQHIGKVGMNSGPNKQFDVADDFVQSPIRRRSGFAN